MSSQSCTAHPKPDGAGPKSARQNNCELDSGTSRLPIGVGASAAESKAVQDRLGGPLRGSPRPADARDHAATTSKVSSRKMLHPIHDLLLKQQNTVCRLAFQFRFASSSVLVFFGSIAEMSIPHRLCKHRACVLWRTHSNRASSFRCSNKPIPIFGHNLSSF